jgi:hypothetical protein
VVGDHGAGGMGASGEEDDFVVEAVVGHGARS